jgi:hypothetical protein
MTFEGPVETFEQSTNDLFAKFCLVNGDMARDIRIPLHTLCSTRLAMNCPNGTWLDMRPALYSNGLTGAILWCKGKCMLCGKSAIQVSMAKPISVMLCKSIHCMTKLESIYFVLWIQNERFICKILPRTHRSIKYSKLITYHHVFTTHHKINSQLSVSSKSGLDLLADAAMGLIKQH